MKFYVCSHCGNIIAFVKSSGVPVVCCGEKMQELEPNTTDAAVEKHVPVVQVDGQKVTVTVGSTEELKPGQKPQAEFMVCPDDEVEAVYAYCNLHGLWKA